MVCHIMYTYFESPLDKAVPSVTIVGYVRHILGVRHISGPFWFTQSMSTPEKKEPSSVGLKSYKAFQTTLCKNSHDYSKAIIKFLSKFQFQILLQFYRTAKKVTKIKLVMVIVKIFDKYHYLFNLHILVTISLFFIMIEIQAY